MVNITEQNNSLKPPPRHTKHQFLVGGFDPFENNISQIGSFPQIRLNIKQIFETTT